MGTHDQDRPRRSDPGLRLEAGHGVARGALLTIVLDGDPVAAYPGETVAAAVMAAGRRVFRTTSMTGQPRGLFCGMGVCYDCLMVIDGRPSRRACMTYVEDGMQVQTQVGAGEPS